MYKLIIFLLLVSLISCGETPKPISDSRQNDFALADVSGGFHRLSRYNDSKAIVLVVQGNGCPIIRSVISDYNAIIAEYEKNNFTFFFINSNPHDDISEIKKEAEDFNMNIPVLNDDAQLLAEALDITITAEAIVLHPTTREIIYRGPINNRLDFGAQKNEPSERYLRDVLDAIANGLPVSEKVKMAQGCKVQRWTDLKESDNLTYTKDVAPILARNCVTCHNPGGIGPWNMKDYETIKGWSPMIKQVLLTKRMPPWKADSQIRVLENDFSMPAVDAQKLMSWIDGDMIYGEGEDPLTTIDHVKPKWKLGAPDEIITLKKQEIPATGDIPYRYEQFKLKKKGDFYLKAVEILPGNKKTVHHILINNISTEAESPISNRKLKRLTDTYYAIAGSLNQAIEYPEGSGMFVPDGALLNSQIHYNATGKPEEDITQIGFYYLDSVPDKRIYSIAPSNSDLKIKPYLNDQVVIATEKLNKAITIYNVTPHMHYRGKSATFSVTYPDGKEEIIVSVPDYDFNWQQLYQLETPISVPSGSILTIEGTYDNSFQNPFNPDPTKEIRFGVQSQDEMLIGFFNYSID